MPHSNAIAAWALIALAINLLAVIEILGELGVWEFHTISYMAHRIPAVAIVILAFFLALPLWWLWHVRQSIAT